MLVVQSQHCDLIASHFYPELYVPIYVNLPVYVSRPVYVSLPVSRYRPL